eukprot:scaffold4796_cov264-Amphora_coffeaeformis.AAC.5
MFPPGSPAPTGVKVSCQTPDGPLQVHFDISLEERFEGTIARKLAARAAIAEYEDSYNTQPRPFAASLDGPTMSREEALQMALRNGLVSDQTSFVAVSKEAMVNPSTPVKTQVIPQHSPLPASMTDSNDFVCGFACDRRVSMPRMHLGGAKNMDACMMSSSMPMMRAAPQLNTVHSAGLLEQSSASRGMLFSMGFSLGGGGASTGKDENPKPVTTEDNLTKICLLQKANGSFALTEELLRTIRLASNGAALLQGRLGLSDPTVFATCIVIVAFRLKFAKERDMWELQHDKAVAFLTSHGVVNLTEKLSALEIEAKTAFLAV